MMTDGMRRVGLFAFMFALAMPGCRSERAPACQRLRQCCAVAAQSGSDIEEIRVSCTRLEDDQGAVCERRLSQVVGALPKLAEEAQCRWP